MIIDKKNITVTRVQDFASNSSVRVHVDLGEIPGDDIAKLWELKKLPFQHCSIILGEAEDMKKMIEMWEAYKENYKE